MSSMRTSKQRFRTLIAAALMISSTGCDDGHEPSSTLDPGATDPPLQTPDEPPRFSLEAHLAGGPHAFDEGRREPVRPALDQAASLVSRGDLEGARELLARELAREPSSWGELLLGLSYHKQKLYQRARPHFEKVLEAGAVFPKFSTTYYYYGWCLYNLGELSGARLAFSEHLRFAPEEGDSEFALGLIALEEGALERAEKHLSRAVELGMAAIEGGVDRRSDVAKAHARLADVHLARDDLGEARRALELCVRIYPPHYTAFYKLYRVLSMLGEDELATQALAQHEAWKARLAQQ